MESVVRAFCRGSAGSTHADKAELTCDGCSIKFNVFKRKKQCEVCEHFYCSQCLTPQNEPTNNTPASVLARFTDRKYKCSKCKVLTARPLCRSHLLQLRSKDLQFYLTSQNVSTRGCVEKDDLVNLLIRHVSNSSSSRSSRSGVAGEFCSQDNSPGHAPSGTSGFQSQGHSHLETSSLHSESASSEPGQYPHLETTGVHNQNTSWGPHLEMSGVHNEAVDSGGARVSSHPEMGGIHNESGIPGTLPTSGSPTQGTSSTQFESWVLLDVEDEPTVPSGLQQVDVDIVELTDWPMEDVAFEEGPVPVVTDIEEEGPPPIQEEEEVVQVEELETSKQACSGITLASINSEADLENLTVKQLKELLILNRVDFRGCCEKAELKERVTRLWFENVQSRKELDNLTMDELCKICMDAPVECVMLECGHMATCTACGKQLSECPICRQYVVRVVRTFKA